MRTFNYLSETYGTQGDALPRLRVGLVFNHVRAV